LGNEIGLLGDTINL